MAKRQPKADVSARDRLLDAAYELFAARGVSGVGIDSILVKSGCAKASLYGNFASKVELALAFLERRDKLWTRDWLEAEIKRRNDNPEARLLAIFDVFDGWFRSRKFEGCSFVHVLLESEGGSPLRLAAAKHLANVRALVRELAKAAHLRRPEKFAHAWHMLMKGSIISAGEGNQDAAVDAKRAAKLILGGWARH